MSLDESFLRNMGGVENNSFVHILEHNQGENDEFEQPNITCHSPYYDFANLDSPLKNKINLVF